MASVAVRKNGQANGADRSKTEQPSAAKRDAFLHAARDCRQAWEEYLNDAAERVGRLVSSDNEDEVTRQLPQILRLLDQMLVSDGVLGTADDLVRTVGYRVITTQDRINRLGRLRHRLMERRKQPCRKTLDTATLRRLCDRAKKLRFSNGPNRKFWLDVDPTTTHVIETWTYHRPRLHQWQGIDHPWNFAHNGGQNVRAVVLCKMRGTGERLHLVCDFDQADFDGLPDA